MASRNLAHALDVFATLDTRKQVDTLRRVGVETEMADKMLGHLRTRPDGHDRFTALVALMPEVGE